MSLFTFNLQSFGLDLSDRSFKLASVARGARGRRTLTARNQVPIASDVIEQGVIKQRDKVVAGLQKLLETTKGEVPSSFAVVSLPETRTFLKLINIEREEGDSTATLSDRVMAELPKEIPLPPENILYDYELVARDAQVWQVLVGAVQRDVVLEYADVLKEARIKPIALEFEAQAIARALIPEVSATESQRMEPEQKKGRLNLSLKLFSKRSDKSKQTSGVTSERSFRESLPRLLVDLGAMRTGLVVYHEGTIQMTRSLELSGRQITQAVARKLKLTEAKAEQAKVICGLDPKKCKGQMLPLMRGWVESLTRELQETFAYYGSESGKNTKFDQVILTGGGSAMTGLDKKLAEKLGIPVVVGDPLNRFIVPRDDSVLYIPRKILPSMTTAIGLAMRGYN